MISAQHLRRMTAQDWAAVMAGGNDRIALYVRSAAEHGFRAAQLTWGQMLLDGRAVDMDRTAALHWFRRSAEAGSPDGLNMVGRCHELGWGVPVDHAEAARWFRKAAAKGSDWGAYNLGCMLLYGEGIAHDLDEARRCFGRAADLGNVKAMGMLGRFAEEGWGGVPDAAASEAWYRRAAEGEDCWGQYNLATLLLAAGERAEALRWLRRSVDTGGPGYLATLLSELPLDDPDLVDIAEAAKARRAEMQGPGRSSSDTGSLGTRLLRRFTRS